jgi:hypothetical protein
MYLPQGEKEKKIPEETPYHIIEVYSSLTFF